ncbi:MAG: TIGR00341 family protein [Spirochaetia bacterium]|nr:TIGR00341 family protein [Spirochaetia bacterium]
MKKKDTKNQDEQTGTEEIQKKFVKKWYHFLTGAPKSKALDIKPEQDEEEKLPAIFQFFKNNWSLEDAEEKKTGVFRKVGRLYNSYQNLKEKSIEKLHAYESISRSARLSREFLALLFSSCVIATFGLFQGSTAVIIGAMLIAPLMMPILGFALGTIWGDKRLIWRSVFTLFFGTLLVLAFSSLLAFVTPGVEMNSEILARTNPNLFDILVALASGVIGAYAYINPNISSSISGVAIAVALMPPLCVVGIGLGRLDFKIALGSFLLYLTNLVGISFSASIVFWRLRVHPVTESTDKVSERAKRNVFVSLLLLVALALPLGYFMQETYRISERQTRIFEIIKAEISKSEIENVSVKKHSDHFQIKAVIMAEKEDIREKIPIIKNKISSLFEMPSVIKIGIIYSEN